MISETTLGIILVITIIVIVLAGGISLISSLLAIRKMRNVTMTTRSNGKPNKSPPPGLTILPEKRPSTRAVDEFLTELSRIVTPKQRKIVDRAKEVNGRRIM